VAPDAITNQEKRFLNPTRLHRQLGLVPNTKPRFSFLPSPESTVAAAAVGERKMVVLLGQWGCSGANRLIAQKGVFFFFYIRPHFFSREVRAAGNKKRGLGVHRSCFYDKGDG
jgi:hypothetical protein